MIIDTHVHVLDEGFWPARWYDWVAYHWGRARLPHREPAEVRPHVERGLIDPDGSHILADMTAAGIDAAVILPIDWGLDFDAEENATLETVHRHGASLARRHPDRIIAFAGVDPRRPGAADHLEWALGELGLRGVKFYPPTGFYPYERAFFPLYELCEARGVPIVFHTGEPLAILSPRFANPLYLRDVQSAFPRLTIWIAHSGAPFWWEEALSVAVNGVNSYLELSTWLGADTPEDELDTLLRRVARARDLIGAHRILFGSDHVSGYRVRGAEFLPKVAQWYRELPERGKRLGIAFSPEEVDLIMGGNAERCLGLGPA